MLCFSSIDARTIAWGIRRTRGAFVACVMAIASAGCADAEAPRDGDASTRDASAQSDAGVSSADASLADGARVAPTFECAAEGTGEIVVQLQLAPTVNDSDLWLAAVCGRSINAAPSDERPLRVVRVPRGETSVTLRNLGDGYYRVIASALGAPSGASDAVQLRASSSAVTFVSVGAAEAPSWTVDSATAQRADAGLTRDSGAGASDASTDAAAIVAPPSIEFDVAAAGAGAGRIGLLLSPRESGWQDVAFSLANVCAAGSVCSVLRVSGIELRVERDGLPAALVSLSIGGGSNLGRSVAPNESFSTESRIVRAGAFAPGARVKLTLFGAIGL